MNFNKSITLLFFWTIFVLPARIVKKVKHTNRKKANSYECLNGKDPSTLTDKQILEEFTKGRCAPVILVPGLLATKLVVVIKDCEKLQSLYPKLFATCGFTHCSRLAHETYKVVPLSEYNIWMPEIFSPLSIITLRESSNWCWAYFIRQNIDFTKPIEESLIASEAFDIRLYGNTPETKKYFKCGDGATENIIPLSPRFQTRGSQSFYVLHERMKAKGYVAGLTYQTLPYNYLLSYRSTEINKFFLPNLKRLHQFTNKKVIVFGHSMGNMQIIHQLTKLTPQEKEKMIKLWIVLAPPFLGSIKGQKSLISGDDDLIFLKNYLGLKVKPCIEALNNVQSTYVLYGRDPFFLYKNEKWFQPIYKRTLYENGKINYEDSGFSFLPKTTDSCSPKQYSIFGEGCVLGLYDTNDQPSIRVLNEDFYLNETQKLYRKWNTTVNTTKFIDLTDDKEYQKFKNPGVPVALVIVRSIPTIRNLNYKLNVTELIEKGFYYYPEIKYYYGDGTVPIFSMVIPPLKWAWEFENKVIGEAKPVKIIDVCSNYHQKNSLWDKKKEDGEMTIENNEFFGITCDCIKKSTLDDCGHSAATADSGFLNLFFDSLNTNEQAWSEEHRKFIDSLDDGYLKEISIECPQIRF